LSNTTTALYVEPKGIGGWLVLPVLFVLFAPLIVLLGITQIVAAFEENLPLSLQICAIVDIVLRLGIVLGWVVAAVRLFKHKRSFPLLFIRLLLASFVILLLEAVAGVMYGVRLDDESYRDIVRALAALLIWVPYMAKSKRVRNTFIEN